MNPVLYILMRTDLATMNPGKAMAQASHASNAFVHMTRGDLHEDRAALAEAWKAETKQGFGTVLVLGCDKANLDTVIEAARINGFAASKVIDPTYPYRVDSAEIANLIPTTVDTVPRTLNADPKAPVTLFREEITCAFVFGDKEEIEALNILSHLKLHP